MTKDDGNEIIFNDASIPSKTVEQIYNEITSKPQTLSRLFKDCHIVKFSDFEQLITKLTQCISSWDVITANLNVTIIHLDTNRVTLNTFEDFKKYDTSSNSPVEAIYVEYHVLEKSKEPSGKPRSYKIEVTMISLASIKKKLADAQNMSEELLFLRHEVTGNVEIEHSNYLNAKFILQVIDDWYQGVQKSDKSKSVAFLKGLRGWYGQIFRFVFVATFGCFIFNVNAIEFDSLSYDFYLKSSIMGVAVLLAGFSLTYRIALSFEGFLARITPLSAIVLNAADKKLVSKYEKTNRGMLMKALGSCAVNFIVSFAASILSVKILESMVG